MPFRRFLEFTKIMMKLALKKCLTLDLLQSEWIQGTYLDCVVVEVGVRIGFGLQGLVRELSEQRRQYYMIKKIFILTCN